jgi:sodium/potassium-transporting ATPase subunit alpha
MRSVNILASLKGLYNHKVKKIKTFTDDLNFHKLSLNELAGYFYTSLTDGLSEVESKQLLTKNGKNVLQHYKKNIFLKLLSYLFTGFCGLLWIGSIVSILSWKPIGNPPDPTNLGLGILILVVIFLQVNLN